MIAPFSIILANSSYFQFTLEEKHVNFWIHGGVTRKLETNSQVGRTLIQTIETFDEAGRHHSYDGAFSYQRIVNGMTVEWKYSRNGLTHHDAGYAHSVVSGSEVNEVSLINGLETSINDFPSTVLSFPNGLIRHWKKDGVYFERPNGQPNVISQHGRGLVVHAWKDSNELPHRLDGPAIIVSDGNSVSEYFFIHGEQFDELPCTEEAKEAVYSVNKDGDDRLGGLEVDTEFDELMKEADIARNFWLN